MRSDSKTKRHGATAAWLALAAMTSLHPVLAQTAVAKASVGKTQATSDTASNASASADYVASRRWGREAVIDNALPVSHIAPSAHVVTITATKATAQLAGFQTAPLPDENKDAPTATASTDPSLRPAFFGRKTTFNGDGFMHGSDIETDQAHRQKPTGGVSLNIPVQ